MLPAAVCGCGRPVLWAGPFIEVYGVMQAEVNRILWPVLWAWAFVEPRLTERQLLGRPRWWVLWVNAFVEDEAPAVSKILRKRSAPA